MFHRTLSCLTLCLAPLALSCSDKVVSCEETRSCLDGSGNANTTDSGDGDTSSGGADSGDGDGDGDTGSGGKGDAGGGADGSGGTIIDPCETCKDKTPACKEENEEKSCVECTEDNLSACQQPGEFCSPENTCVECLDNSHCTEADASSCDLETNTCTGCEDNEGCAHLDEAGTLLCDTENSSCVACLTADDCGGKVCDPDTHSCTNLPAGELFQCEPCQYDAQCLPGRLCVEHLFPFNPEATDPQTVGTYCTWTKEALVGEDEICFTNGQPFANDATVPSVNNPTPTDFCVLATTTCEGYADHRQPNCTGTDDDASCGAEGINDAQCELKGGSTYLCTYPCGGNEDCKSSFMCTAGGYCSL